MSILPRNIIKLLILKKCIKRTFISGIKYSPKLNKLYMVKPIRLRARKSKFRPTTLKLKFLNNIMKSPRVVEY